MKTQTLNLNKMGLAPMNTFEMQEVDGGIFGWDDLAVALIAGVVISALDHWSDIKKGLSDGLKNR